MTSFTWYPFSARPTSFCRSHKHFPNRKPDSIPNALPFYSLSLPASYIHWACFRSRLRLTFHSSSLLKLQYTLLCVNPFRHKDSSLFSAILPPNLVSAKPVPVPATSVDSVDSFPESARIRQPIHKNQPDFDKLFLFLLVVYLDSDPDGLQVISGFIFVSVK